MKKFFLFASLVITLSGCELTSKDPTPELANVVFWTKRSDVYYNSSTDFNMIDVELENFSTSRFILSNRATAPDCLEDVDATFYFFRPGSYKMTAQDTKGRTWKGTVTVQSGCNQVEIK